MTSTNAQEDGGELFLAGDVTLPVEISPETMASPMSAHANLLEYSYISQASNRNDHKVRIRTSLWRSEESAGAGKSMKDHV
jgi:hypothetical protein